MHREDWDRLIHQRLLGLADRNLLRRRRVVRHLDATHVEIDGRRYVNFASNNYLGLSHHPHVLRAAEEALRTEGAGAGASPLVTGHTPAHESAERRIAAWKGTEACVLLPSGYQANVAAVQALTAVGEGQDDGPTAVRFLLDKLVHASLVDAVRQTGAPFRVFPHNNLQKLSRLLDGADSDQFQVVVTESIFSMDGDEAALDDLAALKGQSRGFLLLLDEAHASGVYGPAGAGLAAEKGLAGFADVTVVTLSKALGCAGGAICASRAFCDAVVNLGRAYIYSTALSPSVAAAVEAAIGVLHNEPQHQQRLLRLRQWVGGGLRDAGLDVPAGDSPIIPVILGNEEAALGAASKLAEAGLWVTAIRPPTVAKGTSRLRITLSSAHTDAEIELLLTTVKAIGLAAS